MVYIKANTVLKQMLHNKKAILSIIIAIVIIVSIFAIKYSSDIASSIIDSLDSEISIDESSSPLQATNMWVNWQDYSEDYNIYDAITVDWRCIVPADETYWAVHCWDFGYAGFQIDLSGNKVLLMSLWDLDDGTKPVIEYFSSDF